MRSFLVNFIFIFFINSLSAMADVTAVKIPHPPYAAGQCLVCHKADDAGKPIKNVFVANQPDLCYKCHDRKDTGSVVHPALKSKCTTCHSPHESVNKVLMKDTILNTCTKCHDAPGRELPIQHDALIMAKSCVRCHEPHSGKIKKLLKAKTPQLCTYCHTDIAKGLADPSNTIHPAVNMGCQNCHDPHGSENDKLVKVAPNELCFKCHDKDGFADGHPRPGHPISGVPDKIYPDKQLTCISCHKPHYSPNKIMLRYNFKQAPYDGSICSVCHWQQILPPPGPPTPPWND